MNLEFFCMFKIFSSFFSPHTNNLQSSMVQSNRLCNLKGLLSNLGPCFCVAVSSAEKKMWVRGRPVMDRSGVLGVSLIY